MSKSVGQSKFGTEQEIRAEQTTGPDLGQDDAVTPNLGQASAAESDPGRADGALEPGCLTGEKACYYARLRQAGLLLRWADLGCVPWAGEQSGRRLVEAEG
jgi:hypothetical protein